MKILKNIFVDGLKKRKQEDASDYGIKVVLPLKEHVASATYLFYSTRLAILQAADGYEEWLKQYMIQIVLFYNESYSNFYFFDEKFEDTMLIESKSYEELTGIDIVKYIKQGLYEGWYFNIHLDDFYLSAKDGYQKRHFVHENLIYGFDEDRKVFLAFGFAGRQKVSCFEISYREMRTAYEKGEAFYYCGARYLEKDGYYPVSLCQAKKRDRTEFTKEIFLEKLREYLYPKETETVQGDLHIYGSNIYEYMCRELQRNTDDHPTVDLRTFQLLYEHKLVVQDRITYLIEKYHPDGLDKIKADYGNVIRQFRELRMLYMKGLYQEGGYEVGAIQTIYAEDVRTRISKRLKKAWEEERDVLTMLEEILTTVK